MSLRRAGLLAFLLVTILGVAGGGWILRLRSGLGLPGAERREVAGIGAPVEILRDSMGVPHVWARSVDDALFAQGWLHARDRLWQMEMFRRVVEGRLSEIFGSRTLESDRFLRTLGLHRAAEATEAETDPETRSRLEAYVQGVNAALDDWRGPLPPEFVLLRIRPGPWSLTMVHGIEKVMAWDLTAYQSTLSLAQAHGRLGAEAYGVVAPRDPPWGLTILGSGDGADPEVPVLDASREPVDGGKGDAGPTPEVLRGASGGAVVPTELLSAARVPEAAGRLLRAGSAVRASNSWVVGPERSRSGKPLVANDMHLSLGAPNLWYLMALHAPGLDVAGVTIPGSPGVVAGRTGGVAWGFSNAHVDDADLFVEEVHPRDSTRYRTPDGWEPFRVRSEVIRRRDAPPDTHRVRATRHGPVMTPVESRAGGRLLALRWVAHDPSTTARGILGMNRARDVDEFLEALRDFTDPHQNVVFADTAGRWGYWMAGRVPLRASGRPPLLPVPGWTGENDWVGALPFEDHPHALEPRAGYVVTANNRQSRDSASLLVSPGRWSQPYRASRITSLIRARERHDAASLARIQMDVESAFARRYRPAAVRAFREAGLDSAATALEGWDLRSDRESLEATLFYSWIGLLQEAVESHLYGDGGGYTPRVAVERLLEGVVPGLRELPVRTAPRALEAAGGRAWGSVHQLALEHPLGDVPGVSLLFGFGRGPLARAGAHHTVNVAQFGAGAPPYRVGSGPSQRHVSDLADREGAGAFILPGGQSGLPAHVHSWDQLRLWQGGELWRLPAVRGAVDARTTDRLLLVPAEGPPTPSP